MTISFHMPYLVSTKEGSKSLNSVHVVYGWPLITNGLKFLNRNYVNITKNFAVQSMFEK